MSLLSFLGKVGKGLWMGLRYAKPVLQSVGAVIPGPDLFEEVAELLSTAEAVGEIVKAQGGTKLDKLLLILPQAKKAILSSELLSGHELLDEGLFTEGVAELISAEVKILKAFKEPK